MRWSQISSKARSKQRLHARALAAADAASTAERAEALRLFAANLHKTLYEFEPDFFQHNLLRMVDDVVSVIKGSIELWPTLVEICYFRKGRKGAAVPRGQSVQVMKTPDGPAWFTSHEL